MRRSKIPTTKKPKGAPRGSIRKTLLLAALPAVLVLFVLNAVVGTYHPSACANLGPWQASQRAALYDEFPGINQSSAVTSYICSNPAMNFGEMTSNSTENLLGGNGVVELHSLTAAQVANTSISAAANQQPGSFFFVAIAHIHTSAAKVVSTCVSYLPDPTFYDAASCLGLQL
ncbi:MAG: hypothetical protein JRN54_03910 [Nitrososphaerota archaeon]|jgi:hypothetical protein|nr:hypothetical protein [Nitrososphaerota archaeon]